MYKKVIMAMIAFGAFLGIIMGLGISAVGSIVNASDIEWLGAVFVILSVITLLIGFVAIKNDSWLGAILASIFCIILVGGICIVSLFCGIFALILTLLNKNEFEKGYSTQRKQEVSTVMRMPKKRY